jgi:GNAT superfamily N-acetyltransferase
MTAAGLDRVVAMMAKLYAQDVASFDQERARRTTEALLADRESGGVWMIEMDGAPAGYLVFTFGYSLEFGGRFGLLDELFIEEPWRGQGIGRQAVDFAERESLARGWLVLRLEVYPENQRAIGLYSSSGFQTPDRYLMTKWI